MLLPRKQKVYPENQVIPLINVFLMNVSLDVYQSTNVSLRIAKYFREGYEGVLNDH